MPDETPTQEATRKGKLDRDRILRVALAVVDANSVQALTMRRIATELGVDPMAIYRYLPSKDALLDGVVEALWAELPAPARRDNGTARPDSRTDNWAEPLRTFAYDLRRTINAHAGAAPLLLTRRTIPLPALEVFDTLLNNLLDAGFDRADAAQIIRSVNSAALGDAMTGLTYRALAECCTPQTTSAQVADDTDVWIALSQALPQGTPPALVRTAYAVCACEPDNDFTFMLDLILSGAEELKRERATQATDG